MTPATRTLYVRRFRHRSACFFCLMDRQVTYNEELFQFLLSDLLGNIGIRMQNNPGLQRVANQFFLARALDCLADHAAQPQQLPDLSASFIPSFLWLRKFLQMDGRCSRGRWPRLAGITDTGYGGMTPRFLGGKHENRRE